MENRKNFGNRAMLAVRLYGGPSGIVKGSFRTPSLRRPLDFIGLDHFLLEANRLFDQQRFPQRFMSRRQFSSIKQEERQYPLRKEPMEQSEFLSQLRSEKGCHTFLVHVQCRQHASWQGIVRWIDGKQEQNFRSALELVEIMSDVMDLSRPSPAATGA